MSELNSGCALKLDIMKKVRPIENVRFEKNKRKGGRVTFAPFFARNPNTAVRLARRSIVGRSSKSRNDGFEEVRLCDLSALKSSLGD
jgi:hypothetical protein